MAPCRCIQMVSKINKAISCGKQVEVKGFTFPSVDFEAISWGKLVEVKGFTFPYIDFEQVKIVIDILIKNPTPIPLPLIDISCSIEDKGRQLFEGSLEKNTIETTYEKTSNANTIPARSEKPMRLTLTLVYKSIIKMYDDIKVGSTIVYGIHVGLTVSLPVFGRRTLRAGITGKITIPRMPVIRLEDFEFPIPTWNKTELVLHLKLENEDAFPLTFNTLDLNVLVSGYCIASIRGFKVHGSETTCIQVPIVYRPISFTMAVCDIIGDYKRFGCSVEGSVTLNSIFGPVEMPIHFHKGKKKEHLYSLGIKAALARAAISVTLVSSSTVLH